MGGLWQMTLADSAVRSQIGEHRHQSERRTWEALASSRLG